MPNVLNKAKTTRNLVHNSAAGWGFGSWLHTTQDSRVVEFKDAAGGNPVNVDLKPGCTIYLDQISVLVTVQGGSGSVYVVDQKIPTTWAGYQNWYMSDHSTSKGRGNTNSPGAGNTTIGGLLVPDAVHYIYQSNLDDAGNPDYYVYIDTIQLERGVHPYTRDIAVGSFKTPPRDTVAANATGRVIMDLESRVRSLEGAIRAGRTAGQQQSDYRIADLIARFYAIERNLNGLAGIPAVGSNATYSEDQFILYGEGGNA